MVSNRTRKIKITRGKKALRDFLKAAVLVVGQDDQAICWISRQVMWIAGSLDHMSGKAYRLLADRMLEPVSETGHQEFRLNEAGFKLQLFFDRDGLNAYIGGDQKDDHPEAYIILSMLLVRYGLLEERNRDGYCQPLSCGWFDECWKNLALWAKVWVAKNQELLPERVLEHLENIV